MAASKHSKHNLPCSDHLSPKDVRELAGNAETDTAIHVELPLRLTCDELADLWRVTVRTIQRRVAAGRAPQPVFTGGRALFRREDVLAWEAGRKPETEG